MDTKNSFPETPNLSAEQITAIVKDAVKSALAEFSPPPPKSPESDLCFAEEAAQILGIKRNSLYIAVCHGRLKPYRKTGKRLIFSRKYLLDQITQQADDHNR